MHFKQYGIPRLFILFGEDKAKQTANNIDKINQHPAFRKHDGARHGCRKKKLQHILYYPICDLLERILEKKNSENKLSWREAIGHGGDNFFKGK